MFSPTTNSALQTYTLIEVCMLIWTEERLLFTHNVRKTFSSTQSVWSPGHRGKYLTYLGLGCACPTPPLSPEICARRRTALWPTSASLWPSPPAVRPPSCSRGCMECGCLCCSQVVLLAEYSYCSSISWRSIHCAFYE